MIHRDLREPIQTARRWTVDRAKSELDPRRINLTQLTLILSLTVGGLSINPVNPNIAVTGHLKHDLRSVFPSPSLPSALLTFFFHRRVWDLRKLVGMPEDAYGEEFDDCIVANYEHTKACSAAYWDRSGTKVLTTSYDDVLRGGIHY